jgi:hypothetical protein
VIVRPSTSYLRNRARRQEEVEEQKEQEVSVTSSDEGESESSDIDDEGPIALGPSVTEVSSPQFVGEIVMANVVTEEELGELTKLAKPTPDVNKRTRPPPKPKAPPKPKTAPVRVSDR